MVVYIVLQGLLNKNFGTVCIKMIQFLFCKIGGSYLTLQTGAFTENQVGCLHRVTAA